MIFLVTDIDEPQGVSSDSPWVAKLSVNSALAAEGSNKVSSCVKYLNSVVISVGNNILSNFVNGHTGQAIEFTLTIAITAKAEPVLTLFQQSYTFQVLEKLERSCLVQPFWQIKKWDV